MCHHITTYCLSERTTHTYALDENSAVAIVHRVISSILQLKRVYWFIKIYILKFSWDGTSSQSVSCPNKDSFVQDFRLLQWHS